MTEKVLLEVDKIKFVEYEYCEGVSLEWTEESTYSYFRDTEISIDLEREDAVKIVELLKAKYNIN